jgi:putative tricarboxylic transport membrane protein
VVAKKLKVTREEVMDRARLRAVLPYTVLLAVAVWLYSLAGRIEYAERPGQLGPDFWPKLAIALMGLVCVYEIGKIFVSGPGRQAKGIADKLDQESADEPGSSHLPTLLGGIALTIAYGVLVSVLGFPLATFLFLVAFMYLGDYRAHLVIWLSSVIGTVLISLVFLKVVYVSLPRGSPPFSDLSDFLIRLF